MTPIRTAACFFRLLLSVIVLCCSERAAAQASLDDIIRHLGDEQFPVRESAAAELLEITREAPDEFFRKLSKLFHSQSDPEIRMRIVEVLVTFHQESRGQLGIMWQERTYLDADGNEQRGVGVQSVLEDSAAEEAGLMAGDLITGLNGIRFQNQDLRGKFTFAIQSRRVGDVVTLRISRDSETFPLTVTLGPSTRPPAPEVTDAWIKGLLSKPGP